MDDFVCSFYSCSYTLSFLVYPFGVRLPGWVWPWLMSASVFFVFVFWSDRSDLYVIFSDIHILLCSSYSLCYFPYLLLSVFNRV